MERVGQYLIVRELSVRAYGSVYRARRQEDTDEQGKYLVKVFNPTAAGADEVALSPQVQAALERAALQQKVAQGGAAHWAPIFEHGICEEGAYYVSRFYPSSIRRLIEGRVHLQPASLRLIALGIVDGLLELKAAASRAHGNLSPQTVLLELNDNRQLSAVLLAEPGTDEDAAEAGEPGDLKTIGQLLYQIIISRSRLEALILPLALSEEWKYLGPAAKPWLDLINYLLDPGATPQTHNLELVRRKIAALGAGKAGSPKSLALAVTAVVLLAGLAGGGWYAWRRLHRPIDLTPPIVTTSNYSAAETLYKTYCPDTKLQQSLGAINASEFPELGALRTRLEEIRSQGDAGVTEANLRSLDEALKAAKAWTVPENLRRMAGEALPREWDSLGDRIRTAASAGSAEPLNIAAMLAAANWQSALGAFDWKASRENLAGYAADFRKSGYPLLSHFEELLKDLDNTAAQATEPRQLADMRQTAEKDLALAGTLAQARANPDLAVRFTRPSAEKDQVVKDAEAEIAKASGGRAQAIATVLASWEKRMLSIPAPRDAAAIYEQYKASMADRQKEYEAVKKWTLASEDEAMVALVKQAADSVEGLRKLVNTATPEFQDAKDQADRVLRLLQSRVKEGDTRRQLFEAASKSFALQSKQIEDLIPQAKVAGSTNVPAFQKEADGLREEATRFAQDFKTLGDGDIDARRKKVDDALAALFRRIEEDVGTEAPVSLTLPKFSHDAFLKALSGQWDEFSIKVVGQTRPRITKGQKALLEPARTSIEALARVAVDMEKTCDAVSGLKVAGGEEIQAAARTLPALALANGTRLIAQAIQIDRGRKKLTANNANLLAEQDKWNKSAGQWLACWSEIEKALTAGTGSAEKLAVSNPQLADLTGDVTLLRLREKADATEKTLGIAAAEDPLKQLRARLKTLENFEAKTTPANDGQRAAWFKETLDALKTDKLELASAAARRIAGNGPPMTVREFKDLDATRKLMLQPAKGRLDKDLDAAMAGALLAFARQGLQKTDMVEATAQALEDLKKALGPLPGGLASDPEIKKAISEFARNGLKDAAGVENTAAALKSLQKALGLADDHYARDAAIQTALTESARKGLRNAATVETTVTYMEKVNAAMGFAPKIDDKDLFIRSNLALYRAKLAKFKDADNSAAVALARELLKPDAGLSDVVHKNLVTALQEQEAAWTKYQSQLGAKGGPKDANFALNAQLSNNDLKVFEKKVGDDLRRLAFGRITVNGDAVFLCTTETPIWAVDALVESGKKLGDVLGIDEPVSGSKPVPRPWFTDNDITELRIRPGWLPKYNQGFSAYPGALADPGAPERLALRTANPSKEQPLDWISPDVAKQLATGLGCRLATSAEWLAAAAEQTNPPNLRDSSWEQVATQLNAAPNKESIIPRPCLLEKMSFAPSSGITAWNGTTLATGVTALGITPKWNLPGGAYDDQHPFFWPAEPEFDANAGGRPKFRDLIGNVGEYVVDVDGQIHIAGGSALSDPAAGLGVQKTPAADGISYADVGLRLAFTPVKEGTPPEIAKNIKKLLDDARYATAGSP